MTPELQDAERRIIKRCREDAPFHKLDYERMRNISVETGGDMKSQFMLRCDAVGLMQAYPNYSALWIKRSKYSENMGVDDHGRHLFGT